MRPLLALAALTAGFVATTSAARADDPAALLARIRAATAGATSFVARMQVTNAPGVSGSFTVVLPANFKSEFTFGQTSIESYAIDGMLYVHVPDGGWQKMQVDETWLPARYLKMLDGVKAPNVTLLPDRKANRAMLGAFEVEAVLPVTLLPSAPLAPQPIECTYDKSSFLVQQCATSSVSITYSKYNDPANAVVLPDEAKNAVLVIHRAAPSAAASPADSPSPAGSSSPGPSPSPAYKTPRPSMDQVASARTLHPTIVAAGSAALQSPKALRTAGI